MKEHPILFSGPMVRALLAGTKTQTRRAINARAMNLLDRAAMAGECCHLGVVDPIPANDQATMALFCPYGQPGDRLWVREAWARTPVYQALGQEMVVYREGDNRTDYGGPWKPGIHMFRADSRILLEVTDVRVERLNDISADDAAAEGWPGPDANNSIVSAYPIAWYSNLWEQINGKGSWESNPWVWAVSFRVIKGGQP